MTINTDSVDKLLPQTQCKLCDYNGCRPYATAIVEKKADINRCLPGGTRTLLDLGALLNINAEKYIAEMQSKQQPNKIAKIREDECIGCTKCIQACPTDAIIGASRNMHTVITDACTGCGLCVEPCPVDCIDMLTIPEFSISEQKKKSDEWRIRYEKRNSRLEKLALKEQEKIITQSSQSVDERKAEILAALARVKAKSSNE